MSPRSKGVSAAKATIYVACIGVIGVIAGAVIPNLDKFFGKNDPSQIEAIRVLQEAKYEEVLNTLDSQASALQRHRDGPFVTAVMSTTNTRNAKPTPKRISDALAAQISSYLQSNYETRRAVHAKHRDFLAAVEAGNNLKAMSLKTDVSQLLAEDWRKFTILTKELGMEWPRPIQGMYSYTHPTNIIRTPPERQSPKGLHP